MPRPLRPPDVHQLRSTRSAGCQNAPRPVVGVAHEFAAGHVIPAHSHERAQLLYVAAGVAHVTTDAATFVMPARRAVWIPAGIEHEVRCGSAVSAGTLYIEPAACRSSAQTCLVFDVSVLLRALILEATTLPVDYDVCGRDGRIMALIVDEISAAASVPLRVPMPQSPRLLRICRSILANPTQRLTLDDCARACGMGRRTFTRTFRRETHTTFTAWRRQVRLLEAFGRLVVGESVAKAAVGVGYRSPSALAGLFRKAFGAPPTRYLARVESLFAK